MKSFTATRSARIDAPAAIVYEIIADYHNGHPLMLPKPPFIGLQVEQGGVGAGTIISFQMRIGGATQTFRATITEPRPGRELLETYMGGGGGATTFLVEPDGQASVATITTQGTTTRGGLLGSLEKLLAPMMLRRMYARELALLNDLAIQRSRSANPRAAA